MAIAAQEIRPFKNEVVRDFTTPADRASLEEAIARLRAELPRKHPLVIDGRPLESAAKIRSLNPADPSQTVAEVASASLEQADMALAAATRRFESWRYVPAQERADYLFRAGELMRRRRDDYNALLVLEVGKSWIEADADTAEAIDFVEFYAREALRLAEPPALVSVAGEQSRLEYLPLGAGVVIPPWNFAFAIMAGMTSAALVCGNTVVLKPSSDSPAIAAAFIDLLHEVGLPAGVVNFVPGSGRTIGDALVGDPRTRFISFTGSKDVGLHINELAAKPQPGQRWIKRVIAEMGGKDAIVVAAVGFQGQKCSACSRAIADEKIYDALVNRVVERAKQLKIGDPAQYGVAMGPVINEGAMEQILDYIERGRTEGAKLLAGGGRLEREGWFVEPTILGDVQPGATVEREEIFGPVLAFIKARDFDDALAIANDTEYGLTGSLFSSDQEKLDRAAREFEVGNLYLNRKCTGALVGVHPFGGFNMSGTDSKAGGYDYLLLFTQAKTVAQKVDPAVRSRQGGE